MGRGSDGRRLSLAHPDLGALVAVTHLAHQLVDQEDPAAVLRVELLADDGAGDLDSVHPISPSKHHHPDGYEKVDQYDKWINIGMNTNLG